MALTRKGEATRARIVDAMADIVQARGVANACLDDVQAATGTNRSQVFHYFPGGKADLMRAVAARQGARALDDQRPLLEALDSWEAWERWRGLILELSHEHDRHWACRIGSLVNQLGAFEPEARECITAALLQWREHFERGLATMRDRGDLRPGADPATLAVATLATLQGGLLLMQAEKSIAPLEVALDAALAHLRSSGHQQ